MAQSRSVIITGAAQGIGLAIARRCSAEGNHVFLMDCDPAVFLRIGGDDLPKSRCFALVQDLKYPDAARTVFAHALDRLESTDTLMNNAAWSFNKSIQETTVEEFDQVVAVNQRAPFLLSQEFQRCVKRSPVKIEDPVVLNIASVNALAGNANVVTYTGTKGALVATTRAMAVEMAPAGIRVTCISPGASY